MPQPKTFHLDSFIMAYSDVLVKGDFYDFREFEDFAQGKPKNPERNRKAARLKGIGVSSLRNGGAQAARGRGDHSDPL